MEAAGQTRRGADLIGVDRAGISTTAAGAGLTGACIAVKGASPLKNEFHEAAASGGLDQSNWTAAII